LKRRQAELLFQLDYFRFQILALTLKTLRVQSQEALEFERPELGDKKEGPV
jgi:hypothetical protein